MVVFQIVQVAEFDMVGTPAGHGEWGGVLSVSLTWWEHLQDTVSGGRLV